MAQLVEKPAIVEAAGSLPKRIEEFVGLVNTARTRAARVSLYPAAAAAGLRLAWR